MDEAHEADHRRIVRVERRALDSCTIGDANTLPWSIRHVNPSRLGRALGAIAIASLVVLAACQAPEDDPSATDAPSSARASASTVATASASAESSPSPSDEAGGEEVSVFDVEVGDCFDATGDEIESVTVVDCEASHTYEAYHVFDHEAAGDAAYPGDEAMTDLAETECGDLFEDYVERDYESSIWYISWITPSEETWAAGDREIVCTLHQQDEGGDPIQVTGSAEGSGE
jgi:hypothetical protein